MLTLFTSLSDCTHLARCPKVLVRINIRECSPYPLQLILTVPVVSIDEECGVETLFCSYRLGVRITDINEQKMCLWGFYNLIKHIKDKTEPA